MILGSTILLWKTKVLHIAYAARVLQGIGSAIVWVMSLAIMFDAVGHARIGEFMGYVGVGMNLGTILGPKIGSVVFNFYGLDGVFVMCLCLISGDLALRFVMADRQVPASRSPSVTAAALSTSPTNINRAASQEKPPGKRQKAHALAHRLPSLITLLYRPRFLLAIWGVFIMAVIGDAFKIALPLHASENFGWDVNRVADAYVALAAPAFFGPLFGHLSDRFGRRPVAVIGMLALGACLLSLRATTDSSDHKLLWTLLPIIGVAVTVVLEPLTADIAYIVTKEDESRLGSAKYRNGSYGQGYGLFNTAWSAGNTFGPIWAAHMYEKHNWNTLWLFLGTTVAVTTVPVFLLCGGWWFHSTRKQGL